jgi:hypothetical protein
MTVDTEQKKARISLIRSDIKNTLGKYSLPGGPPFDDVQTVVIDVMVDYLIDCIAELELKVERLEACGGGFSTVGDDSCPAVFAIVSGDG